MSGNGDRGARPSIPEVLESQDLIDPSPVFTKNKKVPTKSPGSSQRRIDVMWGYNINDNSGLEAHVSPSEDTSSPVLNRKKQPQDNQPSTSSIVTDENQVTLPHHTPDVSAGDISTHTRIKVEELKDEVNTQESLFDNEFWNVVNTPYPVDTSTPYRAHTHYQAAIPYTKDRLTSFHEDTTFRAHTRYHVVTEGNIRNPRSYSISVQSNAN